MARQARRLAVSGIYHVMVRGIGRQALFHSVADNLAFFVDHCSVYIKKYYLFIHSTTLPVYRLLRFAL